MTALPLFGNVGVSLTSADAGEVSMINPSSLVFTGINWSTPQTVTLTPADDSILDGRQSVTITAAINPSTTTDANYNAANPTETITAFVDDNDISVTLSRSQATVSEAGGTSNIIATLSSVATTDAVVTLETGGNATIVQDYTIPSTITINAGATSGSVQVTGVDDDYVEGVEQVAIGITSVSGGDGAAELTLQSVTVDFTDNDEAKLTLRHAGVEGDNTTVTEG